MKINPSTHLRHRRGFTLVELLVVIVIIAALAAVGMMATSGLKKRAMAVKSTSNFRQTFSLINGHAAENNGTILATYTQDGSGQNSSWSKTLQDAGFVEDHTKSAFYVDELINYYGGPSNFEGRTLSMAKNAHVGLHKNPTMRNLVQNFSQMEMPSRTLFLTEGTIQPNGKWFWNRLEAGQPWTPPEDYLDGKRYAFYADGHLETIPIDDFPTTTAVGTDGRLFWFGTRN